MKTLTVGQKVWMKSGPNHLRGTVREITERYVSIELPRAEGEDPQFIQLSPDGRVPDPTWDGPFGWFIYVGPTVGMVQTEPCYPRTQFGPWELVDSIC